jgi:SSS family solute:Na+ symporter
MLRIGALDVLLLAAYFAAMIGIGWWARRQVRTMDDYYMGGRRFGKFLMVMFGFGLGTHADTAVGVAAQSYNIGMVGIWYQWLHIFNLPVFWRSPELPPARCITTGDVYEPATRVARILPDSWVWHNIDTWG